MSHLTAIDRRILEDYFQMGGGRVLDLDNQPFRQAIFDFCGIDIYSEAYADLGNSKGKRLRCFFTKANKDELRKVIAGLYEYTKACIPNRDTSKEEPIEKIIARLSGTVVQEKTEPKEDFLEKQFPKVDFSALPVEQSFVETLQLRWQEVSACQNSKAYLAAVIMTGSLLEAVLLGVATRNPKAFNQAQSAAKDETGKPKPFHKWSLAQLIDVAFETGWIDLDVKKHSHSLRDFRNYIHPFEQKLSGFQPTEETLAISMQVFRAAITQIKKRTNS